MKAVALVASEGSARASEARRALRLDPRTKVLMLVCANVTLLCSGFDAAGFVLKFLVAGIVVALLIAAGRRAAGIGFAALLEQMNERGLLDALGSTSAAAVTLRFLSALVLQLMPGTMFAYYLFATTKVSEFVAAMERVRLPQRVIIPFAVVFRFFPTVLEEYRSIRDAMRLRGVGWRSGPVALVEYRLVPLVAGMVKIGDELSAASVTRGLGGEAVRTSRCRIGFAAADAALATVFLACAAATAAKGLMGW